ncbi:hypothetical protein HDE_14466 [Halotydeus destructor]|nr:hypothetical protein HDE_14466 [Halotydeus destructor]
MELLRNFKLLTTVDIVVGEGADLTYLGDIQKLTEHSRTLKRFTFVLSDFAWDAEYEEFLEDYGPQASPGLKEDAVQHCKNVWAIYINQLISMVSCYAKRLPANKVELYLLHGRYKVEPYLYRVMKQVVSHTEVPDNLYVLVGPQGEVI